MKKILVAILVLSMTLFAFVACDSDQVESIELVKAPTIVEYDVGSELSLTGSILKIKFKNGNGMSGEIETSMVDLSLIDMTTVGEKTVTVTYKGHSVTFKINVVDLATLKTNAINELNAYCSNNYYSPENAELVEEKKESGRATINAATNSSAIATALASAKEDIDAVKIVVSTVKINLEDSIEAFEQVEFTITTTAENADGVMVIGTGSFSDPTAILKIEYLEVKNNTWYEMPADGIFGVATGFPLTNATSTFRVTFAVAGTFEFTTNMVAVADETVLCSDTVEIVVGSANEANVTAVKNETELLAALANTEIDTIALTEDITVNSKLAINRSVQIIGNDHTLRSNLKGNNSTGIFTATKVNGVNLTIVDLKIVSGEDGNTTIKAVGIVFEGTTDCNLYVNNVNINVLIYGIHSRTNVGFNARIFNSNIDGYGAYYSRASKNETVLIENSELNGTAYYNGTSNSFATISVQYGGGVGGCENVSITVIDSVVKSGTASDQGSVPFLFVGAGEGFENLNTTFKVYNTEIILDGIKLTEENYDDAIHVKDESTTETRSVTGLVITIDGKTPSYATSFLYDWLVEVYTDIYNKQSVEGGALANYSLEDLIFVGSYYGNYCFENGKMVEYTTTVSGDILYQENDIDGWDYAKIYAKPVV